MERVSRLTMDIKRLISLTDRLTHPHTHPSPPHPHPPSKLNNIYSLLTSINPTPSTLYPAHPHVIPYQRYFATPPREYTRKSGPVQPVYLVRQYFETTLERRLAVRPFLTTSEKTFITYQLLSAFDSMHKAGVTHGDLKTCNIMLTSYNHVIITDLASFKPVVLPSTDPGEFNFFFGPTREGGVKKCYLAPERFRDIGKGKVRMEKRNKDKRLLPHNSSLTQSFSVVVSFLFSRKTTIPWMTPQARKHRPPTKQIPPGLKMTYRWMLHRPWTFSRWVAASLNFTYPARPPLTMRA